MHGRLKTRYSTHPHAAAPLPAAPPPAHTHTHTHRLHSTSMHLCNHPHHLPPPPPHLTPGPGSTASARDFAASPSLLGQRRAGSRAGYRSSVSVLSLLSFSSMRDDAEGGDALAKAAKGGWEWG